MKFSILAGIIALLILASCEDGYKKSAEIDADPMYQMMLDTLATIDSLWAVVPRSLDGTDIFFFSNTSDWNVYDENGNHMEGFFLDRIWLRPEPDTFWIDMIRTDWNDQSWSYHVPYPYTMIDSLKVWRYCGVGYDQLAQMIIMYLNVNLEITEYEEYRTDL